VRLSSRVDGEQGRSDWADQSDADHQRPDLQVGPRSPRLVLKGLLAS
jgi:hypothetical protein